MQANHNILIDTNIVIAVVQPHHNISKSFCGVVNQQSTQCVVSIGFLIDHMSQMCWEDPLLNHFLLHRKN